MYFDQSDRRYRLFDKLRELYHQAKRSGIVRRMVIGGSFVTDKAEPNDFDCVLIFDPSIEGVDLGPMEYNLVSRQRASRIFGGDVLAAAEGSIDYHRHLQLFQTNRNGERVGVVEIAL